MVPLVRAVPAKAAMEMLLTGAPVSAQTALGWGLINRAVAADKLDAAVEELTSAIVAASPLTVRLGKEPRRSPAQPEPASYFLPTVIAPVSTFGPSCAV